VIVEAMPLMFQNHRNYGDFKEVTALNQVLEILPPFQLDQPKID